MRVRLMLSAAFMVKVALSRTGSKSTARQAARLQDWLRMLTPSGFIRSYRLSNRSASHPFLSHSAVDVASKPGEQFIGFDYLHCLADPVITPHRTVIRTQETFHVDAKVAILFGMMECAPTVDAEICVYDPQSPVNPQGFRNTGSKAKHLAFTANAGEIKVLTGKGLNEGAQDLLKSEGAEIVLAKCGLDGVLVFDSTGQIGAVPSYKTNNVFTIGSGDVFVAAFALAWGIHGEDPIQAADYASKAAAQYVETSALPIQSFEAAKRTPREPVVLAGGHIYLAGPFRELGQRVIVNEVRKLLGILGMTVFSPVHDIGHGPAENVVKQDLEALNNCDAVLAILNGSSPWYRLRSWLCCGQNQNRYSASRRTCARMT